MHVDDGGDRTNVACGGRGLGVRRSAASAFVRNITHDFDADMTKCVNGAYNNKRCLKWRRSWKLRMSRLCNLM